MTSPPAWRARRRARCMAICRSLSVTRAARSAIASRTSMISRTADDGTRRVERLHATNNFPEFTGTAPPGAVRSGVRARHQRAAGHHQADRDRDRRPRPDDGLGRARLAPLQTGKHVAVVGSGPAGLAAAQQLTRVGHESPCSSAPTASVACCATASPSSRWRRRPSIGAWPDERRGRRFRPTFNVGANVPASELRDRRRDRASRGRQPRGVSADGREWRGIYQAMEYLPCGTTCSRATSTTPITAAAST